MKYRKIIPFSLTVIAIIFACNKSRLDQPALGQLDETALANKHGVEGLLIGAYALLDGVGVDDFYDPVLGPVGGFGGYSGGASNWIYGSVCGSEGYKGSDPGDQQYILNIERFKTDANNGYLNDRWRALYAGVARTNAALRVMREAKDMTPEDTTEVRAEAVFLRGHYHFEAAKLWNKVPFVDETVTYDADNYYLDNDTTIWPAIENDFKYAMANLPPTQPAVGRANKYAAEAFLAKAYMFQHKYSDAKPLLEELIENGETAGGIPYALTEKYGDNFNAEFKNKSEAVFSVQSSVNDGASAYGGQVSGFNGNIGDILNFPYPNGGAAPGGCCGFFPPSQWLVNHFKTDSITGLPDPDHFNDKDLKNDAGYAADSIFTPYTGTLDPRLDWTVGRRGVPYLDWGPHPGNRWIRFPAFGPYTPKKNSYYKSQYGHLTDPGFWSAGATANNINLMRFVDILLWAAEVEIEIGDPDKARGYINMIRERAAEPSGWVKNEDNIPFAKMATNSQAEFDIVNDPSFTDIQPFDWIVRNDLNQTWVLLTVKADGTKVWNPYSVPNYKVGLYQNAWADKEAALSALRYERVLELGMEGHRFFDLVRWGIADTEINKYFEKEKTLRSHLDAAHFIKNKNEYFPIPQHQIDLSIDQNGVQHLKQNPGY